MRLYALHDARMVARLAGAEPPICESLALSTDDPSDVLFAFVGENPLSPDWLVDLELPGYGHWSAAGDALAGVAVDGLAASGTASFTSDEGEALDGTIELTCT